MIMKKLHWVLLAIFFAVLIWSGIKPHDYFTWFLEVLPGLLYLLVLAFTFKRFRFTNITYIFITIHCCILFIGSHYTYAEVPFFNWLRDTYDLARNNYDKIGHFAQGFIPALIARELLIRLDVVRKKSWIGFITVSICLAISALYELFEWLVAELSGQSAEAFLGTQGYEWDTQSDMLFATIGAICALLLLSKIQDKQIARQLK